MSEANNTPPTNRGVTHTRGKNEPELRILVDWLQITVKDHFSPEVICEDLLCIPFTLMKDDLDPGIKNYRALYRFDNIRLLKASGKNAKNGYQIILSGTGCRNYESILQANKETWFDLFGRIIEFEANVPRLDLAIDDFKTYFRVGKLIRLSKAGRVVTDLKKGSDVGGFSLKDGSKMGDTLYLGSRSSLVFFRFYEKNYEQASEFQLDKKEMIPKWNRYEVELKQKKAMKVIRELLEKGSLDDVVKGIFKGYMRFVNENPEDSNKWRWKTWEPWEWFLKDVEEIDLSIEAKEVALEDFFGWLHKSIAPSLKVVSEIDKLLGTNYLESLVNEAELKKKHYSMIERFSSQLEREAYFEEQRLVGEA
ncbi:replication initiation factor domain-containing protein [Tetragenococcus halophilus]